METCRSGPTADGLMHMRSPECVCAGKEQGDKIREGKMPSEGILYGCLKSFSTFIKASMWGWTSGLNEKSEGCNTHCAAHQSTHTQTHTHFGAIDQANEQVIALELVVKNLLIRRSLAGPDISATRTVKNRPQECENITLALSTANFIHVIQRKIAPLDVFIPDGAPVVQHSLNHHLWLLFTHGLLRWATGELRPQTWGRASMFFLFYNNP